MKKKVYIKWILIPISGIILLYGIACALFSFIPVPPEKTTLPQTIEMYVLSNGVHTDLVLPVHTDLINWNQVFIPHELNLPSSYTYIAIGWGNKDFYINTPTWADLTVKTAVKAGLALGEAAFHVTWYPSLKEGEKCRKLILTSEQYHRLITYISSFLINDQNGVAIPIETNAYYGKYDRFYEAKGRYSVFFTCNTWTNNGLKRSGQPAAFWTPFEWGILTHLE